MILSFQLPFAVVPLVRLTSSRQKMGEYAVPLGWRLAIWPVVFLIIAFNVLLLAQVLAPSSE